MARAHPGLLEAVDRLGTTPWSGIAYRFMSVERDPLSGHGAYLYGGRWNPREEFPCIYLAEPREACIAELHRRVEGQARGVASLRPQMLHTVDVSMLHVLDLTAAGALETVGLTESDVESDDRDACQQVGAAAHFLGAQGVRAPSATGVGFVIAAFERHIEPGQLKVASSEMMHFEY